MKQIENTLQDLKCMLIDDGYTEANIVLMTLIKAQEQLKAVQKLKDFAYEVCPLHRDDDLEAIINSL